MPVVPVSGGPTVGPTPFQPPRTNVETFGGGSAATPIDNSGLARAATNIYRDEKQKADQIMVVDAGSKVSTYETKALYDPQSGALNQKGQNAFSLPETVKEDWDKQMADIEGTLTNSDQKGAFRRLASSHWASIDEQVQRHVANERQNFANEASASYLTAEHNAATASALSDPARGEMAVANQRAAIADKGRWSGWDAETIAQQQAQTVSKTRYSVLESLTNNEQDLQAGKYLADHRSDFVGQDLLNADRLTEAGSVRAQSQRQADAITIGEKPAGVITAGNIDLTNRPRVQNADGTISTVRSISVNEDGKEILIPTVSPDGKILSNAAAIDLYHKTGQHLGIFKDAAAANAYAEKLHQAQAAMLVGNGNGVPGGPATTLSDAQKQVQQIQDPRVRDATRFRVDQFYADKGRNDREQQTALVQSVHASLVQNGGDFTKIPMSTQIALDPDNFRRLHAEAEEIRNPTVKTNHALYADVIAMAALNPATQERFLHLDFDNDPKYKGQFSDGALDYLYNLKTQIRLGRGVAGHPAEPADPDKALKRKEESLIIQSATAHRKAVVQRAGEIVVPGLVRPPVPNALPITQWMADSAAKSPAYRHYLELAGVNLKSVEPPSKGAIGPAPTVPGGPIVRQPIGIDLRQP